MSVHQLINAEEKTVEDCYFMKPHPYAVGWGSDWNPLNKGRRPFPCLSNLYIDWEVSSTLIVWGDIHTPANFVRPGLRQSNALRAFFLMHHNFGLNQLDPILSIHCKWWQNKRARSHDCALLFCAGLGTIRVNLFTISLEIARLIFTNHYNFNAKIAHSYVFLPTIQLIYPQYQYFKALKHYNSLNYTNANPNDNINIFCLYYGISLNLQGQK